MSDPKADEATTEQLPELIAEPFDEPIDDDLNQRLAAAAPRRLANRATYVLLALVIAVAGFVGGAQVQKQYGTPAAASTGSPTGANAGGGQYGGQFPGGGAGRASGAPGTGQQGTGRSNAITGTVKLVDGNTVYIETPDGQTITVKTTDQTTILAPGKLSDLTAGATVSVQGQNTDGTVAATSVTKNK
jgi:hypothetical protein